jgi:alkylation response protein AidB-like acyl-CoA dehydrogenase
VDVRLTPEQEQLRASARDFLARACPLPRVRELCEAGRALPAELWRQMGELGWLGLGLSEDVGGAGLGPIERAVLLEELGRALCPAPYLASAVLAADAVRLAGGDTQRRRWLPGLVDGRRRAAFAFLEESGRWDPAGIALEAHAHGAGFRLDGAKRFVPHAAEADLLVVAARTDGSGESGVTLFALELPQAGVVCRPIAWTDLTRPVAELRFEGALLPGDAALGEVGGAWPALARVLDHGRAALAAELCGVGARVLELSVAFAKTREQFGRPIGAFQAIQHKCADMLVAVEGMRSAAWDAAWSLATEQPDAHVAACMAKAFASDACLRVAAEGIQIHGGLGFTWEQDPQLYFKRAVASAVDLGDAVWLRGRLADALYAADA